MLAVELNRNHRVLLEGDSAARFWWTVLSPGWRTRFGLKYNRETYRASASASMIFVSGLPPLPAISIAFLVESGFRPTFCPTVQT